MTRGDLAAEILVRTGKSTTSGWVSDVFLNDWLSQAHRWASGYKKWPMTEGRVSTTYSSSSEEWDFEGYRADSFRLVSVGGKFLRKLNFEDYQIFREAEPSGTDRVFSDFGGLVYINPKIDLSGTLTAYGQYMPATFDATDNTTETVFSEGNDEGNQAVVEEVIGYAHKRDGDTQRAINQHLIAKQLLDEMWQRVLDEQYAYQTHPDREGMFKRINILKGRRSEELFKENQFN